RESEFLERRGRCEISRITPFQNPRRVPPQNGQTDTIPKVVQLLTILLGPLAGVESRRALVRGWVFAVRLFAPLPPAAVLAIVFWHWWFSIQLDVGYSPVRALQIGLITLEAMLTTASLVLSPALLAGSLAGEKARNTLGLLLACLVSPREIVTAR